MLMSIIKKPYQELNSLKAILKENKIKYEIVAKFVGKRKTTFDKIINGTIELKYTDMRIIKKKLSELTGKNYTFEDLFR